MECRGKPADNPSFLLRSSSRQRRSRATEDGGHLETQEEGVAQDRVLQQWALKCGGIAMHVVCLGKEEGEGEWEGGARMPPLANHVTNAGPPGWVTHHFRSLDPPSPPPSPPPPPAGAPAAANVFQS